ncbi:MAG: substrate-binding domain-containing protein [Pseudomonadota bacterium]
MNRRHILAGVGVAVAAAVAYPAWQWTRRRRTARQQNALLVGGAAAMYDVNVALGKEFEKRYNVPVIVERGGSLQGLLAAKRHAIDIAAMARDLQGAEAEPEAHNYLVGRDAIAVVVNPQAPVRQLRQDTVRDVLAGRITNWKSLGGPNAPIQVVARPRDSSTGRFVSEFVLDGDDMTLQAQVKKSKDDLLAFLRQNPHAIGCVATDEGGLPDDITALEIDGVPVTRETILSARYPFVRSLYLMTYGNARQEARDFIALAESPLGQRIIDQAGFMPVR